MDPRSSHFLVVACSASLSLLSCGDDTSDSAGGAGSGGATGAGPTATTSSGATATVTATTSTATSSVGVGVGGAGGGGGAPSCVIPEAVGTPPVVAFDAADLIASFDDSLAMHDVPAASIAIMQDGELLLATAHGQSDPMVGVDADVETPFALASLSKPFIGVLAMRLVEDGLLDLDADVNDVVGYDVRPPAFPEEPVTVRELLTHTAGIRDALFTYDGTYFVRGDSPIAHADFVAGYFDPASPYFGGAAAFTGDAPGTRACYSNMGTALAGAVVERASGESLPAFAREIIFDPLKMTRTSYLIGDYCDEAELARGCDVVDGETISADNGLEGQPEGHPELASGMIRSTATDIARFMSAISRGGELDGGRVLRPESVEELLRPQLDDTLPACDDGRVVPANQSLLWMHMPFAGDDYVGHYGGMYGFYTTGYFRVRDGLVVSVLLNRLETTAMNEIEANILARLP